MQLVPIDRDKVTKEIGLTYILDTLDGGLYVFVRVSEHFRYIKLTDKKELKKIDFIIKNIEHGAGTIYTNGRFEDLQNTDYKLLKITKSKFYLDI